MILVMAVAVTVSLLFPMFKCRVKNVVFHSFCTPMDVSQLWCNLRKSCMQRLNVAYNFGCRAPSNLPWRTSASSSTQQVQCNIPTAWGSVTKNIYYLFLKRRGKSNNIGCMLWYSQIVYIIRPYCLNTTITFYSVNEWLNFAVFVWLMACHATVNLHFTLTRQIRNWRPPTLQ